MNGLPTIEDWDEIYEMTWEERVVDMDSLVLNDDARMKSVLEIASRRIVTKENGENEAEEPATEVERLTLSWILLWMVGLEGRCSHW